MIKIPAIYEEKVEKWDFLAAFKPPADLSIQSGQIYRVENLKLGSFEYQYIEDLFTKSI